MLRKIFLSLPTFAAASAKKNESVKNDQPDSGNLDKFTCTRSELPLYTTLHAPNRQPEKNSQPQQNSQSLKKSAVRDNIETGVRSVRVGVMSCYNAIAEQTKDLEVYYDVAKEHSQMALDYMNDPDNTLQRVGAIAAGGFIGFICALRRGNFRKLLYTTIGAGSVAGCLYPQEAELFACSVLYEARKISKTANNLDNDNESNKTLPEQVNNNNKLLKWSYYDEATEDMADDERIK